MRLTKDHLRRFGQLGLVLLFFLLLRFYWFWALGRVLYFGDNYSLFVPTKLFTNYWLQQGILPLWNPTIFGGLPWLEDISNSIVYPSTLLFLIFSAGTALMLTLMAHLALTLFGSYFLTWKWTKHHWASVAAAVLWTLSTQVTGSLNNLATAQTMAWLPWVVWAGLNIGRRRWAGVVFAGLVLCQMLAGYPMHAIYSVALAGVFSLYWSWGRISFWRWLLAWITTGLVTAGMTAITWLPFSKLFLGSTRLDQSLEQASGGSLNPLMLVKPILPYFFDKPTAGMKWGPAWSGHPNAVFYVTWLGLVLVAGSVWQLGQKLWQTKTFAKVSQFERDSLFFLSLLVVTLVISMGSYLPGFSLLQEVIPIFKFGRGPSMLMLTTNLALTVWVGLCLSKLKLSVTVGRVLIGLWTAIVVTALVALVVVRTNFAPVWQQVDQMLGARLSASAFHTLERDYVIADTVLLNVLVTAGLGVVTIWLFTKRRWALLTAVIVLDMVYNTQAALLFTNPAIYPSTEEISIQRSRDTQAPFAQLVAPSERVLLRNSNLPYTDYLSFWEAMVVREPFSDSFVNRYELLTGEHAMRLRDGLVPDWNMVYGVATVQGYTTLLPGDYAQLWMSQDQDTRINFIDQIEVNNPRLADWAARYYLVDTWFEISEAEQAVLAELPVVLEYRNWQVYELPALSRFRFGDGTAVEFSVYRETPNQFEWQFDNVDAQPWLVVADRYDPDWQAMVNGQRVTVDHYNGMRRIPVAPGENEVVMWYQPRLVLIGAGITAATFVLVGASWLVMRKRQISRRK